MPEHCLAWDWHIAYVSYHPHHSHQLFLADSPIKEVDVHEGQGTLDISETPDPGAVMLFSLYNPRW